MSIDDIVKRLEAWKRKQAELSEQYDALQKLLGATPDSALWRAIYNLSSAYTGTVSEVIGDNDDWLSWYQYDCKMGRSPKDVTNLGGDVTIRVRTLRQLARVITW